MNRPSDVATIERLSGQKVRARGQQVWRAQADGRLLGFFIVDYVIGKHLVIDYLVALEPDGRVKGVEVLVSADGDLRATRDWSDGVHAGLARAFQAR